MSNDVDWDQGESVEVPQGTFIGWGRIGQVVAGTVLRYTPDGGKDFNGDPCPLLEVEALGETENWRDKGTTKETISNGERLSITAGQANLRHGLEEAALKPTDKVRIEYSGEYKAKSGTGKEFTIKVIRADPNANPWD